MTYSEQVLTQIYAVAEKMRMNLFEATAWYCESLNIEPVDLFNSLDDYAKGQIKGAAAQGRHVQKKFLDGPTNVLI